MKLTWFLRKNGTTCASPNDRIDFGLVFIHSNRDRFKIRHKFKLTRFWFVFHSSTQNFPPRSFHFLWRALSYSHQYLNYFPLFLQYFPSSTAFFFSHHLISNKWLNLFAFPHIFLHHRISFLRCPFVYFSFVCYYKIYIK